MRVVPPLKAVRAQPFKRENKRTRARDAARAAAPATPAEYTMESPAQRSDASPADGAAGLSDFVFAEPVADVNSPAVPWEDPLQVRLLGRPETAVVPSECHCNSTCYGGVQMLSRCPVNARASLQDIVALRGTNMLELAGLPRPGVGRMSERSLTACAVVAL